MRLMSWVLPQETEIAQWTKTKKMLSMLLVVLTGLILFGESHSRTVVGRTGESVTLPCHYKRDNGWSEVCWSRGEVPLSGCGDQLVVIYGWKVREETRISNRYQILGRLDHGDVSLTILDVKESDAGRYGCRVGRAGWFNDEKYHIDLRVVKAPIVKTTPTQTEGDVTTWTESDVTTGSDVTTLRGIDVTPITPTMVTLNQEKKHQNRLQFIGNTVRLSIIIIITFPMLSVVYMWRRRSQRPETDRKLNQSEQEDTAV